MDGRQQSRPELHVALLRPGRHHRVTLALAERVPERDPDAQRFAIRDAFLHAVADADGQRWRVPLRHGHWHALAIDYAVRVADDDGVSVGLAYIVFLAVVDAVRLANAVAVSDELADAVDVSDDVGHAVVQSDGVRHDVKHADGVEHAIFYADAVEHAAAAGGRVDVRARGLDVDGRQPARVDRYCASEACDVADDLGRSGYCA